MESAPVLSTPDYRILDATEPVASRGPDDTVSDEELFITYDIDRTLREIRQARYKRIALQFPDEMLPDAPRVFQLLKRDLEKPVTIEKSASDETSDNPTPSNQIESASRPNVEDTDEQPPSLYILGDTSYGACCVDEVAAEHVNADAVVHYGRSCLSPTARLPVIYVFTHKPLPLDPLVLAFKSTYPDPTAKVILAADVTYTDHIAEVYTRLTEEGYGNLFAAELVHNPSSAIPNRTVPESVRNNPESLSEWQLFHVSEPATALLLTLASRVQAIHIYNTDDSSGKHVKPLPASTAFALRRRYAILTSLSTAPIFGILINTLSVKNYMHIVDHVKEIIAAAGKKSYMFVVGKLNAAKVANFSEIGGWVVIGCWESSIIDSKNFWKPVITPFELELALQRDTERVWTGVWQSDFQAILDRNAQAAGTSDSHAVSTGEPGDEEPDLESAPPEFDLRTGRYVSHSRPMRDTTPHISTGEPGQTLARRPRGDVARIGGVISPGAEFLRSQRSWRGLGSDFDIQYEGEEEEEEEERDSTLVVEGSKGIARGYTMGDSEEKR